MIEGTKNNKTNLLKKKKKNLLFQTEKNIVQSLSQLKSILSTLLLFITLFLSNWSKLKIKMIELDQLV